MNIDPTASSDPVMPELDPVDGGPVLPAPTGEVCGNCGTALFGEHCFHCGQPDHGLVRHFSSVMGDLADTVLQIDTRLTRTIAPLLLRPGYLSTEYFAGRRVRYVSPVRLFFFISVLAFFVAQWTVDASGGSDLVRVDHSDIRSATTVAAVEHERDLALQGLRQGAAAASAVPGAAQGLAAGAAAVSKEADDRIAELKKATAEGRSPPIHDDARLMFGGNTPWDAKANPIHFSFLPAVANGWLNTLAGRAQGNILRIQQNPTLLADAWLSAMPSTLFLLLPLFAVLLKAAYLFKRRLYMEHFIVALHSHSFLCLALLLLLVLSGLSGVATASWVGTPIALARIGLFVWMPLYLLLMQKRVYGQGWIMTLLKYGAIGMVYFCLLSLGATLNLMVKLVWL